MEPALEAAAAAAAAAAGGSGLLRIFVGGLSTSVTAADMEKTFSPMGRVAGIDFVRTNGRSFAYMDFEPASDRALAKLFSTYNGCIWKGGKLKLEKAKEHYLVRLKKEWEEDANANLVPMTPANPIPEKSTGPLKKLDLLKQENMQLKIFFPNLRKVKSVPFKGTGKHKYSFQRIEVPPLPIHFCDCEEHCGPYEMSREKYQSSFDKVINEKELDVMNSVMNKLFVKEGNKTTVEETVNPATDVNNIPFEEDQVADEDNIVTNIGIGGSNDILMHLTGRKTQSSHQETRFGKLQPSKPSKDRFTKNKANSDKRKNTVPTTAPEVADDKRSYPVSIVKPTEDEFTPILSRKVHFEEPEIVEEAPPVKIQTEIKVETFESRKGNSWLQKSSWKDLVGEKNNNSSFSISHLLPGTNSTAPETVTTSDPDISMPSAAKKRKVKFSVEEPRSLPVPQNIVLAKATGLNKVEKSKEGDQIEADNEGDVEAKDYTDVEPGMTASKKRKANSRKDERSFQPVSPILTLEEITRPNHVKISKEGDGIEANLKRAKEAEDCDDAAYKMTEDEPVTVSPGVVAVNNSVPCKDAKQGNCWLQKSSWKDLLGDSSFSISSILPNINTSNSALAISTAATNAKAESDEDKLNSTLSTQITPEDKLNFQPVSPILTLEEITRPNRVKISKEGGGIEANLKGAKEAEDCDDAEHKMIEDEPVTVSPGVVADSNSVPCKDAASSKQGNCWLQKSSWKDLLGDSSFSISSILPTGNSALTISTAATNAKAESDEDKSNSTLSAQITPEEKVVGSHQKSKMKDGTLESSEERELAGGNGDVVGKRTKSKLDSRKGSSFMRSEESLREWRTVKQALSGFIGNKSVEKNTSKGSKGTPSWKGTRSAP